MPLTARKPCLACLPPLPACLPARTCPPCLPALPPLPACPAPPPPALQVLEYIEDSMPPESAAAFGLHPNAEIGFKLREAAAFCSNLQTLQVGGRASGRQGQGEAGLPPVRSIRLHLRLPSC